MAMTLLPIRLLRILRLLTLKSRAGPLRLQVILALPVKVALLRPQAPLVLLAQM